MVNKKFIWNIPNVMSLYRLLSAPFILVLIFFGYKDLFVVLFVINQITDILDGYIARRFNMTTEIGVILDSWADIGSYIIALYGIIQFYPELFASPYAYWLIAFLTIYIICMIIPLIKFGKVAVGLHLYSSKLNGYIQGTFLVVLFIFGIIPAFFYFSMVFGILSELECCIINLISKKPIQNAKGLYWVLKNF